MNPTNVNYLVGAYVVGLGLVVAYALSLWVACIAGRRRRQRRLVDRSADGQ
jgi:hypothetical protein